MIICFCCKFPWAILKNIYVFLQMYKYFSLASQYYLSLSKLKLKMQGFIHLFTPHSTLFYVNHRDLVAHIQKDLPVMQETQIQSLGWKDSLEKRMATHSSIFTWRIPWAEEPGGLLALGLKKVGHNWGTNIFTFNILTSIKEGLAIWHSHPKLLYLFNIAFLGLPLWFSGKESTCQCRSPGFDLWVRKIPWRREWLPISVFLPDKSHRQRSLGDYSPCGHERDMT